MIADLDDSNSTYKGTQKIVYKNNSPETLKKIYFHLYFNAFQPESDMSIRLKNNSDKMLDFLIILIKMVFPNYLRWSLSKGF